MIGSDKYRVLITSSGSKGVPGLIRDLRKSEASSYIVTADVNPEAIGNFFADKPYTVPPWNDEGYISAITEIVKQEKIEFIIPNDGPIGLMKLAELAKSDNSVKIAVSKNIEHLSISMNKFKLFNYLKSNGLQAHVPAFSLVSDSKALLDAIIDFGYPRKAVAIKPPISEGSRGFKIIKEYHRNIFEGGDSNQYLSYEELVFYLKDMNEIPETLVMEYLPGSEYSVDVLVDQNGKIQYMVPRVREQVSEGITVKGIVKKNEEVESLVVNILRKLDLIYALNVQVKYSEEGTPKIIEINPRVSGTMTFCTGAGVNFHFYLILLMLGNPLPIVNIQFGTKMYRYYQEKYYYEK